MKTIDIFDFLSRVKRLFRGWQYVTPSKDNSFDKMTDNYAHLDSIEPVEAKSGSLGLRFHFRCIIGSHAGQRVWYDLWFTEKSKHRIKRDLLLLGVSNPNRELESKVQELRRSKAKFRIRIVPYAKDFGQGKIKVEGFAAL